MSDFRRSDDLAADEVDRRLIAALQDACLEPGLPPARPELAEVFARGVTDREGVVPPAVWVPDPAPGPGPGRRGRLAWGLRSRAACLALGTAVVSVNLVGVGSAGLLPGPLQSGFERVTESVGIEVPASSTRTGEGRTRRGRPPASTRRGDPRADPGRTAGMAPPGASGQDAIPPAPGGTSDGGQTGPGVGPRPTGPPPTTTTSTSTSVPGDRGNPGPGGGTNTPTSTTSTTMPCPPGSGPPASTVPPLTLPDGAPVPGPGVGEPTRPGPSACTTTTTRAPRQSPTPPGRGARP
ncbi:MAG TPA: hypothetical protein VHF27_04560 [Acidimicrobiales bacterium]|nr:hypothetical protein [Acidimicrobiales bacterium]